MTIIRNIHLLLPFLFIAVIAAATPTFADTYFSGPIDTTPLKGIDTIVVSIEPGALPYLLTSHFSPKLTPPLATVTDTVKQVFSKQSWVAIYSIRDPSIHSFDTQQPHVLWMTFKLYAQSDTVNNSPLTAAALTLTLTYWRPDKTSETVRISQPVAYPFAVTDDHDKFLADVAKGVRFLTNYIPTYIYCANKAAIPEGACVTAFEDRNPWGAKPRSPDVY